MNDLADPASEQQSLPGITKPAIAPNVATTSRSVATPQLAKKLMQELCAIRLMKGRWGIRKQLNDEQCETMARAFSADHDCVSGAKKLINQKHELYRAPCSTLSTATGYWKEMTIPFPEDGVRLIKRDRLPGFVAQMREYQQTLATQADALEQEYQSLIEEARVRLADLFDEQDYPETISGLFKLDWEYPSTEPPDYLMQVDPKLYDEQVARIQARFEEAVNLTTEAFAEQFHKLVAHIAEKLSFGEDGQPQKFSKSTIDNLHEFFDKFKDLNVGGSAALESLITEAKQIVGDTDAKALRSDASKRTAMQEAMAALAGRIETQLVSKPRRQLDLNAEE